METQITQSSHETFALGKAFAQKVSTGGILLLYGNLGAGKTTFVQGLASGLGIEKRIISPTFVIMRSYANAFYHIDLYRLQGEKHELEAIGLFDIMHNPSAIMAIEWPEKMESFLPEKRWELHFENIGEDKRKITIVSYL
jgi:tRNA threonylcarbamoyladenosine biosynthesis protein TsaE